MKTSDKLAYDTEINRSEIQDMNHHLAINWYSIKVPTICWGNKVSVTKNMAQLDHTT